MHAHSVTPDFPHIPLNLPAARRKYAAEAVPGLDHDGAFRLFRNGLEQVNMPSSGRQIGTVLTLHDRHWYTNRGIGDGKPAVSCRSIPLQ